MVKKSQKLVNVVCERNPPPYTAFKIRETVNLSETKKNTAMANKFSTIMRNLVKKLDKGKK